MRTRARSDWATAVVACVLVIVVAFLPRATGVPILVAIAIAAFFAGAVERVVVWRRDGGKS